MMLREKKFVKKRGAISELEMIILGLISSSSTWKIEWSHSSLESEIDS